MSRSDLKEAVTYIDWAAIILIGIAILYSGFQTGMATQQWFSQFISNPLTLPTGITYPLCALIATIIIMILYATRLFSKLSKSTTPYTTAMAIELSIYTIILLIIFSPFAWFAGLAVGAIDGILCYVIANYNEPKTRTRRKSTTRRKKR